MQFVLVILSCLFPLFLSHEGHLASKMEIAGLEAGPVYGQGLLVIAAVRFQSELFSHIIDGRAISLRKLL